MCVRSYEIMSRKKHKKPFSLPASFSVDIEFFFFVRLPSILHHIFGSLWEKRVFLCSQRTSRSVGVSLLSAGLREEDFSRSLSLSDSHGSPSLMQRALCYRTRIKILFSVQRGSHMMNM